MPVEIPKDPKVYTTVYDNFRGVDYTHDPTNVYRRRSPNGKNMLPDMEGRPFKRSGWKVEIPASEFRRAANVGSSVEVIHDKTYYFELGGQDYIAFFTNLGIFTYTSNPDASSAHPYFLVHHPNYKNLSGVDTPFPDYVDSKRAFFFEGGGEAGFYVFLGESLLIYQGSYFYQKPPKIPLVLVGCEPSGEGTFLEDVNLLTPERTIQYSCDGKIVEGQRTGSDEFIIPDGVKSGSTPEVLVRSPETYQFVDPQVVGLTYTIANGKIDFSAAPLQVSQGEDNLQITYIPDGYGTVQAEDTKVLEPQIVTITQIANYSREKEGENGTPTDWQVGKVEYQVEKTCNFSVPHIKVNQTTKIPEYVLEVRNIDDDGWAEVKPTLDPDLNPSGVAGKAPDVNVTFNAYTSTLTVTPKAGLWNADIPRAETVHKPIEDSAWYSTGTKRHQVGKVIYKQTRRTVNTYSYLVRLTYDYYYYRSGGAVDEGKTAFSYATRASVYGSGIINQVFLTASTWSNYNTRVWYSYATDPSYFPDTNYIEVGATDTPIMGLMKVGGYLGVIKQGAPSDTSIYLAYPTTFDDNTTYAVKQSINGIGAVSNGAFNILNEEPMFLSAEGIMAIEVSEEDTDRQLRNRSFYINKPLVKEPNISDAISFVYDGMYWLAVNNRCYVLDGSQKLSWENSKTNLQYEAYYLENIPAHCFSKFNGQLWFTDTKGNACRFKGDNDDLQYVDEYYTGETDFTVSVAPSTEMVDGNVLYYFAKTAISGGNVMDGDLIHDEGDDVWYTVTKVEEARVYVGIGCGIDAVWGTIADDDGTAHYFKNLKKKGSLVSILPATDSGVKVYLKPDEKPESYVGETDSLKHILPYDFYTKKKIKKYKRLQIICRNNSYNDSFGIAQIIKSYTFGNYSKNKG